MPGVMSRRFCVQPRHCLASSTHSGPRPDQAHVALHHVEELRQLVDAPAPERAADAGDARVFLQLEHRAVVVVLLLGQLEALLVRAHVHGAELEDLERLAAPAHPLLPVEDRAARIELDDDRDDAHERQEGDAEQAADDEVEHALHAPC